MHDKGYASVARILVGLLNMQDASDQVHEQQDTAQRLPHFHFVFVCNFRCIASIRRLPGKLRVRQSEIIKRLVETHGDDVQVR